MNYLERDLRAQAEKYKNLFLISEKLHSCMDMETLLEELFVILHENYSDYSYCLFLSFDTHSRENYPIKELEYDSENVAAAKAYALGEVQFEQSITDRNAIIYAPLKGIQGVYGVLQMIARDSVDFPESEIEFITLLAGSVGHAIENAKLYQQSEQLVCNLKLLNEATKQFNSNLKLEEAMSNISQQIQSAFQAEEVGFFVLTDDQLKVKLLPGSTSYFYSKLGQVYIQYFKEKILQEKDSLYFADFRSEMEDGEEFHSIMAVPVYQGQSLKGFAIVMHHKPYFFTFDTYKLLQTLIQHSSLAIMNHKLREELNKLVITDYLTKLHSRKYLDEKILHSMNKDKQGTFILIDIDNFKKINDTYGHQVGDEILVQVANVIKANIREKDIGARWGGEELAIYLPMVSLDDGTAIAKRLIKKVEENSNPRVTVSCGVSYWYKDLAHSYQSLFKRADEALYVAKTTGKNRVVAQTDHHEAS